MSLVFDFVADKDVMNSSPPGKIHTKQGGAPSDHAKLSKYYHSNMVEKVSYPPSIY